MERHNARHAIPCPCYDPDTKTDCPRRCGGCQVGCPDWADYLKRRDELYKKRDAEAAVNQVIVGSMFDRRAKYQKDYLTYRRQKRRGQS